MLLLPFSSEARDSASILVAVAVAVAAALPTCHSDSINQGGWRMAMLLILLRYLPCIKPALIKILHRVIITFK
mgnify:CR=1 FL=1